MRRNFRSKAGYRALPLVGAVGIVALLTLPAPSLGQIPPGPGPSPLQGGMGAFDQHVQHIVIVMMENHAYDNLFGVYCLKLGPYCSIPGNGLSPKTCVPLDPKNLSAGCATPYNLTSLDHVYGTMFHTAASSTESWDHGALDGFYLAEHSHLLPFGHYTANSTATLWDMAEEYALGDQFFSSILSYSLPNHWHLVAGQSPVSVQKGGIEPGQGPVVNRTLYLGQANRTPSIEDSLLNSSATWKWYEWAIGNNYSKQIVSTAPGGPAGRTFSLWNPQAAKAESYNASFSPHFVDNTHFYADAAAGALPNVSWVIPLANDSDHPAYSHFTGESWLASVVDAVETSPEWNSTTIFVTWDEYGGFYDHVPPPIVNGTQLGFRVPLLVIGPYVRENFIGSGPMYFDSLLHLVEVRFGLGCFTALDCNAPLPLGFFNFTMSPRAPLTFGTIAKAARYPMPLQPRAPPRNGPRPEYVVPYEFLHPPLDAAGQPDLGLD